MNVLKFVTAYKVITRLDSFITTPALAAYILANHNNKNRKISPATVAGYVRDILAGRWLVNGDRIVFDRDGDLIDGQHRLMAIVKANVALPIDYIFGLENETRATVDGGRNRSVGDNYNIITGSKDGSKRASRVNWVKKGINPHRDRLSYGVFEQVADFFERGLGIVDKVFPSIKNEGRAPSAAAFIIMAQAYPTKVQALMESIKTLDLKTDEERTLANYVKTTTETEDTLFRKTLYGVHACITGVEFKRLQSRGYESILEEAIEKINTRRQSLGKDEVSIEDVVATPVFSV